MMRWLKLLVLGGLLCLVPAVVRGGSAAAAPPDLEPVPDFTRSAPLGPVVTARAGARDTLTLATCVAEALAANDRLRAERLKMAELEGKMKQALSTGLPTVDLVGNWNRSRDPSFALGDVFGGGDDAMVLSAPLGADPWFDTFLSDFGSSFGSFLPEAAAIPAQTFLTASAKLAWEINPVKILGAVGAARLGIEQQDLSTRSVEQETIETTLDAYYAIIRAAEDVQAIRAQLANQSELLEITSMRYELGLATRLDTLQAAVTVANTRPQLAVAEARLRNVGSHLNAVLGRRPETPLSIANRQFVELDPLRDEMALTLAQDRPELAAVGLFVDILGRQRQAQSAEVKPYLTLGGAYGYVGTEFGSIFQSGHDTWSANVALNVPIFDGLLTKGLVDETEARIRRTEAELLGRRRAVQVEVLEILANVRLAREVLAAVQLNLGRSEEVLDESLLMLQLGKVNYLEVLVAEANRAEARSNVIDARYEVLTLTASLKRAIGWSPMVPLGDIPGLTAEVAR